MTRINKQVIVDYFKTFFGQYRLTKEHFTKIRDLVDDAECGCCKSSIIYWTGDTTPADYQILFKDADDNILSQTSVSQDSPQRICIPREATQLCLDIINAVTTGESFTITGSSGFNETDTEAESEFCYAVEFPFDDVYIVNAVDVP